MHLQHQHNTTQHDTTQHTHTHTHIYIYIYIYEPAQFATALDLIWTQRAFRLFYFHMYTPTDVLFFLWWCRHTSSARCCPSDSVVSLASFSEPSHLMRACSFQYVALVFGICLCGHLFYSPPDVRAHASTAFSVCTHARMKGLCTLVINGHLLCDFMCGLHVTYAAFHRCHRLACGCAIHRHLP